jgi:hypothetical protein
VSDYQFKNAKHVSWRNSTFAEWIEVKDLGTTDRNFHSPTGCVFLTVYTD